MGTEIFLLLRCARAGHQSLDSVKHLGFSMHANSHLSRNPNKTHMNMLEERRIARANP
jgi:hypothetical protein